MHNNEFRRIFYAFSYFSDIFFPLVFWISAIFSFGDICSGVITVLAAGIHEGGHICFLFFGRNVLTLPRAVCSGLRLRKPELMSYREEALYAAMGPIANIIAAGAALPFFGACRGYAELFAAINLTTALSNLLPLEGYDGYRILYCLCSGSEKRERLQRLLTAGSCAFLILMCFFAFYLMARFGIGYWICFVFLFSLVSSLGRRVQKRIF